MIGLDTLIRARDEHQSYCQTLHEGDTTVIVRKLPFTNYEVNVIVGGSVRQLWRGLSPFDCKNVVEDVLASVKNVNSLA